jgi:hypothetical protein
MALFSARRKSRQIPSGGRPPIHAKQSQFSSAELLLVGVSLMSHVKKAGKVALIGYRAQKLAGAPCASQMEWHFTRSETTTEDICQFGK